MREIKILYINYINRKFNSGEIRHPDFSENNFEYKNIEEIKDTDEPIMLEDFINKYHKYYNSVIVNLNRLNKNIEEYLINKLKIPKIIYINK